MNENGYIGAVPNQPLIISSPLEIAEFSFQSSGWFAEPNKSLDPMLVKELLKSSHNETTNVTHKAKDEV